MWGCPIAEVVGLPHSGGCGAEMGGCVMGLSHSRGCGAEMWGCVMGLPHSGGCGAEMWGRPIAEVVGLRCGPAP